MAGPIKRMSDKVRIVKKMTNDELKDSVVKKDQVNLQPKGMRGRQTKAT